MRMSYQQKEQAAKKALVALRRALARLYPQHYRHAVDTLQRDLVVRRFIDGGSVEAISKDDALVQWSEDRAQRALRQGLTRKRVR